jgi:hypothetical protein
MFNTIKAKTSAIDILRDYSGKNPYLLRLKRDVILKKRTEMLNDYVVEYIIKNKDFQPITVGKTIKIADWLGEKMQKDYQIEFVPQMVHIFTYLGDTSYAYYCVIKYRQNMEPIEMFLPKKGVLGNFLVGDYHNLEVDFDRYDRLSSAKDPNRKIKPHQKEAVQFLLSRKKCILADDMGLGKMEPISSVIPTENGFKTFGELVIGDNVFGEDGKLHPITKIFEHKGKEIYKVTFSDGTFSYCGLDHLWKVRTKNMTKRKQGWKTMSLKELIESKLQYTDESRVKIGLKPRNKYEIPVTLPVQYKEKEYIIHPYVLGVCIGDGNLCNNRINISIPDNEKETANRIESLLREDMLLKEDRSSNCPRYRIMHKVRKFKNDYISEIKRLGLNVKGNDKFIPTEYKLGSISQRLDLLRGLMDSDGTIGKNNRISFSTNSEKLANDVSELVFSLGGIARIGKYNHKGKKNIEYQVRIQIKENPFYLKRKSEKYSPTYLKYCSKYIVSAEYDRNEDARCIMVDYDEHTYITGKNYIVTHNTTELSVAAIEGNFDSVLIICPASLKTNWRDELLWYVNDKDISIIDGVNDKTKPELEKLLGYKVGKSGLSKNELLSEAKERGKWEDNRFVIVNYDILGEFYKIPKTRSQENIKIAYDLSPMLQYISNKKSLIIIDEAHRLSNSDSDRYKIINDLIKRGNPDSIYLATGTPVTNNPSNLYCILKLLNEDITLDWNYYMERYCGAIKIPAKGEKEKWTNIFFDQLRKIYIKAGQTPPENWKELTPLQRDRLKEFININARKITVLKDPSNLDELKLKVAHIYLRRTKEDISEGLPNKSVHEMFYDFDMIQEFEYARLWEEYETQQLELDPTKEINKELLEGAVYRRYCSNEMVPNTIKLADSFIKNGDKVVIATCFDEELNRLKEYYGDKCVVYNGKMSPKQKDAAKNKFLEDDNIMVFIGNIISAGVGLTLVVSNKLIFNDISYVPGDNKQMQDRIYRIGQKRDVDIYYQLFRGTQYEKMWNTVMKKELVINQVIKKEDEK